MKTMTQTKEVVLTKAQYEARKAAGTLVSGKYKIKGKIVEVNTADPTSSTIGHVGQFYLNTTNNKLYICAATSSGVYTWVDTLNGVEVTSNKITVLSSASTDDQYPSAKAVYDFYTTISGYDPTKTQTLKNVNGALTWIDD